MKSTTDVYVRNVNVCTEDSYKASLSDILNIEPYYMEIKQILDNIYCCTVDNLDEMSKCIKWLQNNKFKNFVVKKIYVSRIRSEIYVIADFDDDKIGEVLDEYYEATFTFTANYKQDIVFMITSEKNLVEANMPKFEEVIEVTPSV